METFLYRVVKKNHYWDKRFFCS